MIYCAAVELPEPASEPRRIDTGFWIKDAHLLAAAPVLSASRDWLRKDGEVFPIIGTTYMASDVHRKFLFEPNPHVWDRDFSEMARRGVNFVRTGLWTAWGRVMLDPGAIDEGILLALEAVICFSYFWGKSLHPASCRLYIWLDTFVAFTAAWLLTELGRRISIPVGLFQRKSK